jgi:hypothetical protein
MAQEGEGRAALQRAAAALQSVINHPAAFLRAAGMMSCASVALHMCDCGHGTIGISRCCCSALGPYVRPAPISSLACAALPAAPSPCLAG